MMTGEDESSKEYRRIMLRGGGYFERRKLMLRGKDLMLRGRG
jgi:hypothetical protein